MTGPGNKRRHVRCPWCSRQPVAVKRGRIVAHLNPGGVRCVGGGMRVENFPPGSGRLR